MNLFWKPADGSATDERLTTSEYIHTPASWSPDGRVLAFYEIHPATARDIWVLSLDGEEARPFLRTASAEGAPMFSPDGRWLAYTSDESGRSKSMYSPFPARVEGGKSRPTGDRNRFGRLAEASCSTAMATTGWPWRWRASRLLFRGNRGCSSRECTRRRSYLLQTTTSPRTGSASL